MKHLFKHTLLFLGIVVMTFSCQKENLNEQDPNTGHQQGGNTLFRKGKLSEFSHVKDFITEIKNKNGAKQTVDIQYRTGLETENDFIILENQDIAIHSGDEFNTYTIPIIKYQQPQGTFSNLVVQFSVASDSTNAYILTYEPNAGYLDAYALDDRTPFSGQVSYESLDYDGSLNAINTNYRMVCNSLSVTYCKNGEYGGIGSTHAAGPSCIVASNIWTETYTICYETDDGFGSRSETIEPPEGSGGGGGGSSSSPNTGNSTSTIPADLVSEVIGILSLNISNHQQEIAWLESFTNFPDVISMYLYLDNHKTNIGGYEQEALGFAEIALEALMDEAEVVFEDDLILADSFKSNEKAKCVYERLTQLSESYFSSIMSDFDGSKVSRLTFKVEDIPQTNPDYIEDAITLPRYSNSGARTFDIILDPEFVESASLIEIALTLIHESIHAEIMERCIQLGIISTINFNSQWEVGIIFNNGQIASSNLTDLIFAMLVQNYSSYNGPPQNTNWQHDIFSTLGYRTRVVQDLAQVHNLLNDTNNPFEDNLNNGTILDLNMNEYFELMSWIGLEGTDDYSDLSPLELTKIEQAFSQTEQFYNHNCN